MADWRARGYVPDSDDDEEDEDVDVDALSRDDSTDIADSGLFTRQTKTGPSDKSTSSQPGTSATSDRAHIVVEIPSQRSGRLNDGADTAHFQISSKSVTTSSAAARKNHDGSEKDVSPLSSSSHANSIATRLEAELEKGLQTVQDILGALEKTAEDDTDSPLSSLPSSIANSPRPSSPALVGSAGVGLGQAEAASNHAFLQESAGQPMRRSFRPRAPIQVHPYALEDAKYRQTLKSRGLKPVRLQQIISEAHNTSEEDSQGADTYESSQTKNSETQSQPSSPVVDKEDEDESQSPVRGVRPRFTGPQFSFGDDLPDLSDFLGGTATQDSRKALKKVRRPRGLLDARAINDSRIYDLPTDETVYGSRIVPRQSPSFQIPPSPPSSRGALFSQDGPLPDVIEHLRRDETPTLLPTPLLSSESHSRKRARIESLSSSDSEKIVISDDSPAQSSASESSGDESNGIQRMRRKIKGVLPASWLKLDVKGKNSNLPSRQHARSPVKSALEKGIAQRISSSEARRKSNVRRRPSETDTMVFTVAESDSDEPRIPTADDFDDDDLMMLDSEVVEDNSIDAMLAPRTRKTVPGGKQPRLRKALSVSSSMPKARQTGGTGGQIHHSVNRSTGTRSKRVSRPKKKHKKRNEKLKPTVLDAPGFQDKEIPLFLKVARRRAGRSGHLRPQEPSKKFFRLATVEDTLDVNHELIQWCTRQSSTTRTGGHETAGVSRSPSRPQRRRSTDMSQNFSLNSVDKDSTELTQLKQSTKATLQRIQTNQSGLRTRQPQLDSSSQRRPNTLECFQQRRLRRPPAPSPRLENLSRNATHHQGVLNIPQEIPPIVRLVPQHPAKLSGQRLTPNPTTPSISPFQIRRRPPRKLPPKALQPRSRNISPPDGLSNALAGESADHHPYHPSVIISQLIDSPPGPARLKGATSVTSIEASILARGGLQILESETKDTAALFDPSRTLSPITTPKSGRTLSCAIWSEGVRIIMQETFGEIRSAICSNDGSSRDEHESFIIKCAASIESIIIYIQQSLSVSGVHELTVVVTFLSACVNSLRQDIESVNTSMTKSRTTGTLLLWNRVLILGQQILQLSRAGGLGNTVTTEIVASNEKLANLAWSLVLQPEITDNLLVYLATQSESQFVSVAVDFQVCGAAIETIIILHQLHPGHRWVTHLDHAMSALFVAGPERDYSAEKLAYTILILGCVYSVTVLKDGITGAMGASLGLLKYPDFSVLSPAMTEFLKYFVQETSRRVSQRRKETGMIKLEQFGLIAFQWCLVLARTSHADVADNLLKQLFKLYSEKSNMLDFFSPTLAETPRFLEQRYQISQLRPEAGDTDFHIFLKLTAFTLGLQPDDVGAQSNEELRRLKLRKVSLVFSLLPNNGRGAGDDRPILVEESHPLPIKDLGALANRYHLFSTLYHYAPVGVKPEISKIKDLVDFGNAHDAVCTLALECWASTVRSALSLVQPEAQVELHRLAVWIYDMVFKISDKLQTIPRVDGTLNGDDDNDEELLVYRRNRATANWRLMEIAKAWAEAIELCVCEWQARYLMLGPRFGELLGLCNARNGGRLDDLVISALFNVLATYLKQLSGADLGALKQVRDDFREILISHLYRADPPEDELLLSLIDAWHKLAQLLVESGNNTWDDYFSMFASYSLWRFGGQTESARHCRVIMTSYLLKDRAWARSHIRQFLAGWLAGLLRLDAEVKFEHLVTNSLLTTFDDLLDFRSLKSTLAGGDSDLKLTRDELIRHRLDIVRHVVRNIYNTRDADDLLPAPQSSDIGLTTSNAECLLETITAALRDSWTRSVEGMERQDWTRFLDSVMREISRYPFRHFKIPAWFSDRASYKRHHLHGLFVNRVDASTSFNEARAVEEFRLACEMATVQNTNKELEKELVMTFSASDPQYIDDQGNFLLDIPTQLCFMKAVFPVYMEHILDPRHPAMLLGPVVVTSATAILDRLETRIDLEDQSRMEEFARMMMELMKTAVKALQSTSCDVTFELGMVKRILARLVNLCANVCTRWGHLHLLFQDSAAILALQPLVQTYGLYVYEYACSAIGLDCEPTDPDFWRKYPSSQMRAAMSFGFDLSGLDYPEGQDVAALREGARANLERAALTLWKYDGLTRTGPVWSYNWDGVIKSLEPVPRTDEGDMLEVGAAVAELVRALEVLGVK
ncbi:hypothetical protein ABEF91_008144 [Exophiala dermatitidis]